jgi:hypothetical protein
MVDASPDVRPTRVGVATGILPEGMDATTDVPEPTPATAAAGASSTKGCWEAGVSDAATT